jgi:hypothetical protein
MHSGHIQEWRDYLATQMRAQYGLAEQEAQKITDRWLRSANVAHAGSRLPMAPRALGFVQTRGETSDAGGGTPRQGPPVNAGRTKTVVQPRLRSPREKSPSRI